MQLWDGVQPGADQGSYALCSIYCVQLDLVLNKEHVLKGWCISEVIQLTLFSVRLLQWELCIPTVEDLDSVHNDRIKCYKQSIEPQNSVVCSFPKAKWFGLGRLYLWAKIFPCLILGYFLCSPTPVLFSCILLFVLINCCYGKKTVAIRREVLAV